MLDCILFLVLLIVYFCFFCMEQNYFDGIFVFPDSRYLENFVFEGEVLFLMF